MQNYCRWCRESWRISKNLWSVLLSFVRLLWLAFLNSSDSRTPISYLWRISSFKSRNCWWYMYVRNNLQAPPYWTRSTRDPLEGMPASALESCEETLSVYVTALNLSRVPWEGSSLILCVSLSKWFSAAFNHAFSRKAAGMFWRSVVLLQFQLSSSSRMAPSIRCLHCDGIWTT